MGAGSTGIYKENVLIQAGECSVEVAPRFGGKISSIRLRGQEFLQAPLAPMAGRNRTMPFAEGDAGGWDECLPSVAECRISTAQGVATIPDHGDLWRVEWAEPNAGHTKPEKPSPQELSRLSLAADCFSLPLRLERTLQLSEKQAGWRLDLGYKLSNTGSGPVPWSWSAHPLFSVEAGDRIVLPDSVRALRVEGSGANRVGKSGDTVAWPIGTLKDGTTSDLSLAQAPESEIGDKLFAGPLNEQDAWCALERPAAGVRIRVSFEAAATPYLGIWICYGGWPERPGPKQYCVALEPATAPVDSLAETGSWSRTLEPGGCFEWTMHVDFELI